MALFSIVGFELLMRVDEERGIRTATKLTKHSMEGAAEEPSPGGTK